MIRYASGAFVTSPTSSVMAEAGALPFEFLATQSTARTAIRILAKNRNNSTLPLIQRTSDRLEEITGSALPAVDQLVRQSDRLWHTRKPSVVWDVKNTVRAGDPPEKVRPVVQQLLSTRFQNSTIVYTDGSKLNDMVGSAFYLNGLVGMYSLPNQCSVFSAEAYALKMAVSIPNLSTELVVLTDSASCLLALEGGKSKHPWIQQVEHIAKNKPIRFCWIPGHAGISGNVEADRLAGEARGQPANNIAIPGEDALRAMKQGIRQRWNRQWYESRDSKLREIKNDTHRWADYGSAADQRILTRLRIGHTRLTHTFLLKKEAPPTCECCGSVLDVRHLILECRKFDRQRQDNGISSTNLQEALTNEEINMKKVLKFLHDTGLYTKL